MSSMSTTDSAESVRAIGRKWCLLALFGVITIGFGVVLTFKPGKSVHAIAVIIGISVVDTRCRAAYSGDRCNG